MLAISSNGLASRAPDKLVLHDCTQLGGLDASAQETFGWLLPLAVSERAIAGASNAIATLRVMY